MASKALRPIRIEGNDAFITLTKGYTAVIDAADVPLIDHWNWTACEVKRKGKLYAVYAVRSVETEKGRRLVYLHRELAATDTHPLVDHRDGDGLNNRRKNLRPADHAANMRNQRRQDRNVSGTKGVRWDKARSRWVVTIGSGGKTKHLGRFFTLEAASAAYEQASRDLHGEFGRAR